MPAEAASFGQRSPSRAGRRTPPEKLSFSLLLDAALDLLENFFQGEFALDARPGVRLRAFYPGVWHRWCRLPLNLAKQLVNFFVGDFPDLALLRHHASPIRSILGVGNRRFSEFFFFLPSRPTEEALHSPAGLGTSDFHPIGQIAGSVGEWQLRGKRTNPLSREDARRGR